MFLVLSCFEEQHKLFLQEVVNSLKSRYDDIKNDKLLDNLHIFDPCNFVNLNKCENLKVNKELKNIFEALPHNLAMTKRQLLKNKKTLRFEPKVNSIFHANLLGS